MEMENPAVKSLNKISLAVNQKIQTLWENEASIKFYDTKCEEIQKEIDQLNEEIDYVNLLVENCKPEIEQLQFCVENEPETLKINHQSLINQELFTEAQTQKVKDLKTKQDNILLKFDEDFKKQEDKLKNSNDLYNVLVEKRVELKKTEIDCKILEQKCAENRLIHKNLTEIRKKIFYNDVVQFATWWLKENRIKQYQTRLEIVRREEQSVLKEWLTLQDQKIRQFRKPRVMEKPQPVQPPEKVNILELLNKVDKAEKTLPSLKSFNTEKSKVRILDVQNVVPANIQPPQEPSLSQSSLAARFERFIAQRMTMSQEKAKNEAQEKKNSLLAKYRSSQEIQNGTQEAPRAGQGSKNAPLSQMRTTEVGLPPIEENKTIERPQMVQNISEKQGGFNFSQGNPAQNQTSFNFSQENQGQQAPPNCQDSFTSQGFGLFGDRYSRCQEVTDDSEVQFDMANYQGDANFMGRDLQSPVMLEAYMNRSNPDFSMEQNNGNPIFKMPNSMADDNVGFSGFGGFNLY